jgi:predicted PurR-regulated permease PerM
MTTIPKETRGTIAQVNQLFLFVILLVVVLYFGRDLLVPFVSAAFFAMLMAPISRRLEKILKRPFAVIACVLILLTGILGILAIIIAEINSFAGDLPQITATANNMLHSMESTIQDHFGVEPQRQVAIANEQIRSLGQSAGSYIGRLLAGTTQVLGALVIILLYTFLLLYHRERYELFFIQLFGKSNPEQTKEVIENITRIGQHYIKGRTVSVLIIWLFYAVSFSVIGLKNGILLGAIASLLSIIPFVGGIIGGVFPFFMALTDPTSSSLPLQVIVVIALAHALSTYFIEPLVVGGRMKLSALSMIVFIIIGSALWGIAGMILFIPMLAMVKILCDYIPNLKPYSYLISDPDEGKTSAIGMWASHVWGKVFTDKK